MQTDAMQMTQIGQLTFDFDQTLGAIEGILLKDAVFVSSTNERPSIHRSILENLKLAVSKNEQLNIILPAFPAKSSNRDKTLGHLPDMGEVIALRYLNDLCRKIKDVYMPGARVIVCSDGRVFNDLVMVTDIHVDEYRNGIYEIMKEEQLENLSFYSLEDVYRGDAEDFASMRKQLMDSFW